MRCAARIATPPRRARRRCRNSEEVVLTTQGDAADGVLGDVVICFEAAIGKEAAECFA